MTTPTGPKITAVRGWDQFQHTMSKKMPQRLTASQKAREGLRNLMNGKGR